MSTIALIAALFLAAAGLVVWADDVIWAGPNSRILKSLTGYYRRTF